jgi:hypothetical protein
MLPKTYVWPPYVQSFVISLEGLSIVPLLFCIFFILEYIWFVAGTASVNPLCLKLL